MKTSLIRVTKYKSMDFSILTVCHQKESSSHMEKRKRQQIPTTCLLMLFTFSVELLRVNVTSTTLQMHVKLTCISSAPSLMSLDRLYWKQWQTVIVSVAWHCPLMMKGGSRQTRMAKEAYKPLLNWTSSNNNIETVCNLLYEYAYSVCVFVCLCVPVISELSGTGCSSAMLFSPAWRASPDELRWLLLELTQCVVQERIPLEFFGR